MHVGFLYMKNERVVVLLNNVAQRAHLGPLQNIRRERVEPEAQILILPRRKVEKIELLEELG